MLDNSATQLYNFYLMPHLNKDLGKDSYIIDGIYLGGDRGTQTTNRKPFITVSESLSAATDEKIACYFTMGFATGARSMSGQVIRRGCTRLNTEKSYIYNNEYVEMDAFDYSHIPSIQDRVRYKQPTIVSFSDVVYELEFIERIHSLIHMYKYYSCFFFNAVVENQKPFPSPYNRLFLLFTPIEKVFQIFNNKRIHGMCLSIRIARVEKGTIKSIGIMDIVFSNYLENIFVIDGQEIARPASINYEMIKTLKALLNSNTSANKKGSQPCVV